MKIKVIDFGYDHLPNRAHANDAGADVYTMGDFIVGPHESVKIPLGLGLCLPDGYAAFVFPRSGMSSKGIVCELPPIDSGYRGEIHAIVSNLTEDSVEIPHGTRIGQLVITPIVIAEFIENDFEQRGDAGFGSTGE